MRAIRTFAASIYLVVLLGYGFALAQEEAGGDASTTVGGRVAAMTAEQQQEKARAIVDKGEKLSKTRVEVEKVVAEMGLEDAEEEEKEAPSEPGESPF